jgi:hypothetical protein
MLLVLDMIALALRELPLLFWKILPSVSGLNARRDHAVCRLLRRTAGLNFPIKTNSYRIIAQALPAQASARIHARQVPAQRALHNHRAP